MARTRKKTPRVPYVKDLAHKQLLHAVRREQYSYCSVRLFGVVLAWFRRAFQNFRSGNHEAARRCLTEAGDESDTPSPAATPLLNQTQIRIVLVGGGRASTTDRCDDLTERGPLRCCCMAQKEGCQPCGQRIAVSTDSLHFCHRGYGRLPKICLVAQLW